MEHQYGSTSSNTNRKRTKDYSEKVWPKRMRKDECNVLFSKELAVNKTIVKIGDKTYVYTENQNCEYDIMLSQNTFTIKTGDNK